MRLKDRLRRLEDGYGFAAQCSECGFGGEWSKAEVEVAWADEDTAPEQNEYCPECARALLVVVRWGDEP